MALLACVRGLQALLDQEPFPARVALQRSSFEADNRMLSAWNNLPEEIDELRRKNLGLLYHNAELSIADPELPIGGVALQRLGDALGQGVAQARFVLRLLDQLGLLKVRDGTVVVASTVGQLFDLPMIEQARLLANAWASQVSWSEVHDLQDVLLRRNLSSTLYLRPDQVYGELAAARRYVVRLVRALDPGRWHSLASLAGRAFRLRPRFLLDQRAPEGSGAWYIADADKQRLELKKEKHWKLVGEPFIRQVVCGLGWLGIVALDEGADALQLTTLGACLLGLSDAYRPEPGEPALRVSADLRIRLPIAAADAETLALLDRTAALERLAAGELHYRLTPRSLRDGLAAGQTSAELRDFLQHHSRPRPPRAALDALDVWAAGFGRAQLYSGLTLLELADELLLPELLRATSLSSALFEQLSPRLLLIDPARSDALWAELVAKGYTPQRVQLRIEH
jgi:hypothetical protein